MTIYSSCSLYKDATKIFSSLKHLDPSNSCEIELAILDQGEFKIDCVEFNPVSGECSCNFIFYVNENLFAKAKDHLPKIESHLETKAHSVLKFFPGASLKELKVLAQETVMIMEEQI